MAKSITLRSAQGVARADRSPTKRRKVGAKSNRERAVSQGFWPRVIWVFAACFVWIVTMRRGAIVSAITSTTQRRAKAREGRDTNREPAKPSVEAWTRPRAQGLGPGHPRTGPRTSGQIGSGTPNATPPGLRRDFSGDAQGRRDARQNVVGHHPRHRRKCEQVLHAPCSAILGTGDPRF